MLARRIDQPNQKKAAFTLPDGRSAYATDNTRSLIETPFSLHSGVADLGSPFCRGRRAGWLVRMQRLVSGQCRPVLGCAHAPTAPMQPAGSALLRCDFGRKELVHARFWEIVKQWERQYAQRASGMLDSHHVVAVALASCVFQSGGLEDSTYQWRGKGLVGMHAATGKAAVGMRI